MHSGGFFMDKVRSEALKIVDQRFTIRDVFMEFDRRNRIIKESRKALVDAKELETYIDEIFPIPDKEFEDRLKELK